MVRKKRERKKENKGKRKRKKIIRLFGDEKGKLFIQFTTSEISKIQHRCLVRKWKRKQKNDVRNSSTQRSYNLQHRCRETCDIHEQVS